MKARTLPVVGILAVGSLVIGAVVAAVTSRSPSSGPPRTCDRTATSGGTLANEFAAATAGQTICLTAGAYGTFRAGAKPGTVTVRPRPGDSASVALEFEPAVNVRIEGLTVTAAYVGGRSRNVTIADSRFTGLAAVNVDLMADAKIVFDSNTHANIDTCPTCRQGRLHIEGDSGSPSGVVIRNSVFSGGNSDGVRADAHGVAILDSEFTGLREEGTFHTDPIQIYGGTRVVIRGNYFRDNEVAAPIMMADGGAHNVVEDNVIAAGGYTWALVWYSDNGSVISHNTFADGSCDHDLRCGLINLSTKAGARAGRGTVIRDNVLGGIRSDGTATFAADHNLTREPAPGVANVTGVPRYLGPASTYAGHRLAPASLGRRDGSDGSDRGIRVTAKRGASSH